MPNPPQPQTHRRGLVVGNYCHDVLLRDHSILASTLGGAASFISNVLDALSLPCHYVSKVGSDFAYSVPHPPISSHSSRTTLFHAHFSSAPPDPRATSSDRILKRVHACDPILPSDLPDSLYQFGLAVGVGGEISPATLERMLDLCAVVFADVQGLIRVFDSADGTVGHVGLRESGFFHLLPRIGVLKASAEEAPFVDVEEVRKWCCVVVTDGEDGCRVYWRDGEMRISPFPTTQVDPTGAGDSFLGGMAAGLNSGMSVPDAALVGNFFGSLTVGQIGLPKFESWLLERVKEELLRRKLQPDGLNEAVTFEFDFRKSAEHEDLHGSLTAEAKLLSNYNNQEPQCNGHNRSDQVVSQNNENCSNDEEKKLGIRFHEESVSDSRKSYPMKYETTH